uniref:Laminin EGF-like domain-containing protein n=1 Tax=Tetranychus urticae TaxID=32264 RepID=T1KN70_TETUR
MVELVIFVNRVTLISLLVENTLRPNCDVCRRGTYNLEKNNPQGCTKCFCFGTTENCRSSEMRIAPVKVDNYSNWTAVGISFSESGMRFSSIDTESSSTEAEFKMKPVAFTRGDQSDVQPSSDARSNIYFKLPKEFLGNRITSYGGFIQYVVNELPSGSSSVDTPITPDIILTGRNDSISLTRDEQPESAVHDFTRRLQSVYIRASYFSPVEFVSITNFTFDSVSNEASPDAPLALRVEQCICPPNYRGSSCEECASGYYRVPTGPYLGSCIPCECNGHSNECDPLTGKCFNCQHETTGDHCELCKSGYYGNATIGKPDDCLMCPCPLPNNFADSCEIRTNARLQAEWNCNCKPGYSGQLCEFCAAGHFGYPMLAGNYCQPCNCNGNTDPTDPGSCDLYSGECTKCLNYTAGKSCEYCADGYYGDAIELKDCRPCECDETGTAVCDRYSGKCECHPNVVGKFIDLCDSCDECKPNHYGFNTGKGCTLCNCSIASKGEDCDLDSGNCRCQPGVTGRTCDVCEVGYWKYSKSGCESCGCVEKYSRGVVCNQQTGKCECLPGVVGEKCDKCPWRWVFVDREGCLECGECQHALLNDTDALENDIMPIVNEFSNSSSGIHAKKAFLTLNNTVTEFNKQLAQIIEGSKTIDLTPLETEMTKITNASDNLPAWQDRLSRLAAGVVIKVDETKENATLIRRLIKKVKSDVQLLFEQLDNVDYKYNTQADEESIKFMITKAEENKNAVERFGAFTNALKTVANETESTMVVLDRVEDYIAPYVNEKATLNESESRLDQLETILTDANEKIVSAMTIALDVQRGLNRSREAVKEAIVPRSSSLKNLDSAISANLKEAKTRIDSSEPIMKEASGSFDSLVEISNRINGKKDSLEKLNPEDVQETELLEIVKKAGQHASSLNRTATDLDFIFMEAIRQGDLNRTMRAATAYEVIENSIESAEKSMNNVISRTAEKPWEGIRDKISATRSASTGNRTEASALRANILNNGATRLSQFNETIRSRGIESGSQGEQLKKIDEDLASIEISTTPDSSREVMEIAEASIFQANKVSERVDKLIDEINSLSNATKQLTEAERKAFIDIHESTSMTSLYGERGIGQKIRDAMERVTKMVNSLNSSKNELKKLKDSVVKARDMPDEKNRITDYLIAKLVDGVIIVTVDNGEGAKDSEIKMRGDYASICNGDWHTIKITKLQNAHFVTVDDESNVAVFTPGGVNVADTLTPLYLGDVPDNYRRVVPDLPPPYIGCIKDIEISRPMSQANSLRTDTFVDCENSGATVELCPTI